MTNDPAPQEIRGRDLSVPLEDIIPRVTGLSLLVMVLPVVLYWAIWGYERLMDNFNVWTFIGLLVLFTLWHEGFHAIGWKYWGGLRWRDLKFGVAWYALTPYCHAKAPMRADAYRFGALLPGIMTGLLPYGIALALGNGIMAIVGAVMLSGAVGDAYVLWVLRELPPDALVLDHPSNAGCIVVDEGGRG